MDKREQAFKDYKKGMKYKDIAEKYEVTESCVKSWAARYWNKQKDKGKVATDNKKSRNQKSVKSQPKSREHQRETRTHWVITAVLRLVIQTHLNTADIRRYIGILLMKKNKS